MRGAFFAGELAWHADEEAPVGIADQAAERVTKARVGEAANALVRHGGRPSLDVSADDGPSLGVDDAQANRCQRLQLDPGFRHGRVGDCEVAVGVVRDRVQFAIAIHHAQFGATFGVGREVRRPVHGVALQSARDANRGERCRLAVGADDLHGEATQRGEVEMLLLGKRGDTQWPPASAFAECPHRENARPAAGPAVGLACELRMPAREAGAVLQAEAHLAAQQAVHHDVHAGAGELHAARSSRVEAQPKRLVGGGGDVETVLDALP